MTKQGATLMQKYKNIPVSTLQLNNQIPYQKNLDKLLAYIDSDTSRRLIVAPEVCLTDYDYDNIDSAVEFSSKALELLTSRVDKQTLVLTLLAKKGADYVNEAVVIHNHQIVHRQSKHKLFLLGEEDKHLQAGKQDGIKIFEVDGIKYGLLICFEVRFKELWRELEGADVILVPSQWGIPRKRHLEILPRALAIMNQCYVVVSNSAKETMASSSAIYSPNGGVILDDMLEEITGEIDLSLIKKIRRYLVMG
jgi:predicted amidohydrolase